MKKNFFTAAMCVAMMFVATISWAFDAPGNALYGLTPDGTYYISVDLIKAANGAEPKAMFDPTWQRMPMKLDGNYYIYASGKQLVGKTVFCFDIGNNQYIPHVLASDPRIKQEDLKLNPYGYPNFNVAPK